MRIEWNKAHVLGDPDASTAALPLAENLVKLLSVVMLWLLLL